MNFWLLKSESGTYSWDDLVKEEKTSWTGVRNFQARNNLRAMKKGDKALFYHSGDERAVVGTAEIVREWYPDPTATEGDWVAVDITPIKECKRAVPLDLIKTDPALRAISLIKQMRLSVCPITEKEYARIVELGK